MSFRLDPAAALCSQVLALLDEEASAARRAGRTRDAIAVHAIRRHGKRSRALLRLVQPALPGKHFTQVDHAWRDIGRSLASIRDHVVIAACLIDLRKRYPEDISSAALGEAQRSLPSIAAAQTRSAVELARRSLADLRSRLRHLRCRGGWSKAISGYVETLKLCRAAQRRAVNHRVAEHRHEWRKRVKDVRYQTHLLGHLCPGVLGHLEDAWDRLGETLGQENDLVMTRTWLASLPHTPGTAALLLAARHWLRHLRGRSDHLARGVVVKPQLIGTVLERTRAETG